MTHQELSWKSVYQVGRNNPIAQDSMKLFFSGLLKSQSLECEELMMTVFLKGGQNVEVPYSKLENFIAENKEQIESRKRDVRGSRRKSLAV